MAAPLWNVSRLCRSQTSWRTGEPSKCSRRKTPPLKESLTAALLAVASPPMKMSIWPLPLTS